MEADLLLMLGVIDPLVGVVGAAAVGALGTYLVAWRRFRGEIGSSAAEELWTEAREIRKESQDRISALEARVRDLEKENYDLKRQLLEVERAQMKGTT